MFEIPAWVAWLVAAAALTIGEMLTVTFFLICFAAGAAAAAIAAGLDQNTLVQWITFTAVSSASILAISQFARKATQEPVRRANSDRLVGLTGKVLEEVNRDAASGRVLVGHEEWRAYTEDSDLIVAANTRIRVCGIEGTHLIVEPVESSAEATQG